MNSRRFSNLLGILMAKTMRKKEFKNSNVGGKPSELLVQCQFPNKFDFRQNKATVC